MPQLLKQCGRRLGPQNLHVKGTSPDGCHLENVGPTSVGLLRQKWKYIGLPGHLLALEEPLKRQHIFGLLVTGTG